MRNDSTTGNTVGAGQTGRAGWRPQDRFWLIAIMVLGVLVRIPGLYGRSLWFDETWSTFTVFKTPLITVARILTDIHPPLWSILIYCWGHLFGDSEFSVRLPAFIFAVASIPVIYRLGYRMFGSRAGLAAALLLSLTPFHVWYSREARMYSMLVFFTLLSSALLFRLLTEDGRTLRRGYAVVTILALLSHFFSLFIVIFQIIAFLLLSDRRRDKLQWWVSTMSVIFLTTLPWYLFSFLTHQGGGAIYLSDFSLADAAGLFVILVHGRTLVGAVSVVAVAAALAALASSFFTTPRVADGGSYEYFWPHSSLQVYRADEVERSTGTAAAPFETSDNDNCESSPSCDDPPSPRPPGWAIGPLPFVAGILIVASTALMGPGGVIRLAGAFSASTGVLEHVNPDTAQKAVIGAFTVGLAFILVSFRAVTRRGSNLLASLLDHLSRRQPVRRRADLFALAYLFLPALILYLVTFIFRHLYFPRNMIILVPAFCLLAGRPAAIFRRRWLGTLSIILFLAVPAAWGTYHMQMTFGEKPSVFRPNPGWRECASYLQETLPSGAPVLMLVHAEPLLYYAPGLVVAANLDHSTYSASVPAEGIFAFVNHLHWRGHIGEQVLVELAADRQQLDSQAFLSLRVILFGKSDPAGAGREDHSPNRISPVLESIRAVSPSGSVTFSGP